MLSHTEKVPVFLTCKKHVGGTYKDFHFIHVELSFKILLNYYSHLEKSMKVCRAFLVTEEAGSFTHSFHEFTFGQGS